MYELLRKYSIFVAIKFGSGSVRLPPNGVTTGRPINAARRAAGGRGAPGRVHARKVHPDPIDYRLDWRGPVFLC